MKNSSPRYSSLTVFQALFARPRSSLDTTFGSIINQALPTNCKHKVLVRTNYTSDSSEIRKARALVRFAELKNLSRGHFRFNYRQAKLMELLMLCHNFPQWKENLQAENTQILYQLNGPLHQSFVYRTHAFSPLFQL